MECLILTNNSEDTFNLGRNLGQKLKGGEVICLIGELGAGKTVFAKGLGLGLGIRQEISSPTFTLIQEYQVPNSHIAFIHMDLYRLKYPEEAEIIGVTDYFRDDVICLIEWPEIIADYLPSDRLEVKIMGSGDLPRTITFQGKSEWEEIFEDYEILNN